MFLEHTQLVGYFYADIHERIIRALVSTHCVVFCFTSSVVGPCKGHAGVYVNVESHICTAGTAQATNELVAYVYMALLEVSMTDVFHRMDRLPCIWLLTSL
jgi:hypothetical protein